MKTGSIKIKRATRNRSGQSIIFLGLLIAFFVIGSIGLFTFEVNRVFAARNQLRAACDAASLSAAATLASQNNTDPMAAHTEAINTAINSFQLNKVMGVQLAAPSQVYSATDNPPANHSSLFIEFLDPHNNNSPVSMGDPKGKIVRISAAYGLQTAFGQFLGIGNVPIRVSSSGGVPQLDVVLCFDVSGSIDDQTPVTFVKRNWNHTTKRIDYTISSTYGGSPAGSLAQGKIYDILVPVATGTRVNGVPPQYLALADSSVSYPMIFSEQGGTGAATGLRGSPNTGSPPGNYSNSKMSTGYTRCFTDMVVNIDGKDTFAGTTYNGYSFPNVGVLVEAARGNLENNTVFTNSKANSTLASVVSPQSGYQAAYYAAAKNHLHPIKDAQDAANVFFDIMNTNTDAHFGLVAFSDNAGTSTTNYYKEYNVDSTYSSGGQANFPIPEVSLNSSPAQTNYNTVISTTPTLVATTATNIGDSVAQAIGQLTSSSRPGSKKAIVVFTDGQPSQGGPYSSDPWTNCRQAAVAAKNAGIPIYTIGLAQNSAIIPGEVAILNDTNSNSGSGGMAAIAGNGGKFFLVTDVNNLQVTFENIARQLVQLVR